MANMIVISQGQLVDPERVDAAWPVPVIHSTWKGERILQNGIYSDIPAERGRQNVCLQQKSTLAGLEEAKKRGYTHAFKVRSDLVPFGDGAGAAILELQKPGLNFLFWHNWDGGYHVDYLMSGPIDELIKMWSFTGFHLFPERLLTNQINECNLGPINYFGDKITKENDLYWIKNNIYISNYNLDPRFIA